MSVTEMKTATFVLFAAGDEDGSLQALYGNRKFLGSHIVDGHVEAPETLADVLEEFGVTLKQAGINYVGEANLEKGDPDFYYFDGEMHDGVERFDKSCFPETMTDKHIEAMFDN